MAAPDQRWRIEHGLVSRRRFLAAAGAGAAALALAGACGGEKGAERTATPPAGGSPTSVPSELYYLSLEQVAALIATKQVSPVEVTQAALDRIQELQPKLNAFITITGERALAQARAAEAEIAAGNYRGKLHGIPIAQKDLFDTVGIRTTAGSTIYRDRVPDDDAAVVSRLSDAGGVMVGKLNMWEFAAAIAGVNEHWGTVVNPWNLNYLTGGTSAGSAAATAAGLAYATTGSDTGGSIRSPASFCGVVGFKPTYGRVSRYGMIPPPQILDHVGPIARNVRDIAIVMQSLAGADPRDAATAGTPVPQYLDGIEQGPKGLRVGVPRDYFWSGVEPEYASAVEAAIDDLARSGAEVRDVPFPKAQAYYDAWRGVAALDTAKAHASMYPSRKDEYGKDLAALLSFTQSVADWDAALREPLMVVAAARAGDADAVLNGVDVLLMPTNRTEVMTVAEARQVYERSDLGELEAKARAENVAIFNLTGQPALSLPCGRTSAGMPVGLMLVARQWDEATLLRAARAYEFVRGPFPAPPI